MAEAGLIIEQTDDATNERPAIQDEKVLGGINSIVRFLSVKSYSLKASPHLLYSISFVIRAKKNRNVIYNAKTCNIMDAATEYKGNYRLDFKDKKGKTLHCRTHRKHLPERIKGKLKAYL